MVSLMVGNWTCDSQVAGSSPGRALSRSVLASELTFDFSVAALTRLPFVARYSCDPTVQSDGH